MMTLEGKQRFIKAYTRNFTIIMQEAWFAANSKNLIQALELKEFPYDPPYIYFMKEGVEEVWENVQANEWLLRKLEEKISHDENFFDSVYDRYFGTVKEIESVDIGKINSIDGLNSFIDVVYRGVADFVILYGALFIDRIAEQYKDKAVGFREKDSFFSDCNIKITAILKQLFPELKHMVVYITREELFHDIDVAEIKKRDYGFALIPGVIKEAMSFGDLLHRFPNYEFEVEEADFEVTELKGSAAFLGKVSGTVRVLLRTDQIDSVMEGDIIVSPMTTPDFLPAMKRAGAFVTDEGGITCHAAIVARELKKPCVIGTKFASKVLKDGDMVEVDADKGVVKKI